MAHQIEAMFFVGETPWHGLGQRVVDAPTTEEAIKQAGLNWRVIETPIYLGAEAPKDNAPAFDVDAHGAVGSGFIYGAIAQRAGQLITSHKAIVRATDGQPLGIVGNRYQPLQNIEAFAWFDPLVSSGLVQLETAGSLQQGKRIWILARITGDDVTIVGDDVVRKFILLSNSHDGTLAVRVGFTPIRVVCANTLAMSHADGQSQLIRLKHSRSLVANLDALRDIVNIANQSFEATAEQFRRLAAKDISRADLQKYVKTVLGHAETKDDELSTRATNQINDVISLFERGRGSELRGARGTVWGAYNAVTEYLSHVASANDGDKRYNSLWFGSGATRNQTALAEAIKLAA